MTAVAEPYDDAAYIDECLAGSNAPYVRWTLPPVLCRWCVHPTHGLGCRYVSQGGCKCESSHTSRDDSWRPNYKLLATNPAQLMHDTGIDGYTAAAVSSWDIRPGFNPTRIRNLLLGKGL